MDNEETSAQKNARPPSVRLRKERERHGWSQSELAKQLGTTQVNISRWEQGVTIPGPYFRQKLVALLGKSLEELGLFEDIGNKENKGSTQVHTDDTTTFSIASLPSISPLPLLNVPHRHPFFTGREDILASLHTALIANKAAALTQAQAISGLGGIGKTQTAIEYAYRYGNEYQAILWVTASTRNTLIADFSTLAVLLHLPEQSEQNQEIVVRAVKRWLATYSNWLLIVDNVDDLTMLAEFLPTQGAGCLLLTTRLQALGLLAQSIEIEKMELDEGVTFLLRRTKILTLQSPLRSVPKEHYAQAAEIVRLMDGLPLALDQAGAYIEETKCNFFSYLNLYHTSRKELLQRRGRFSIDHPESVVTTWLLSFEQVRQESLASTDLLYLLAFLSPEVIPEEIISEGITGLGATLDELANNPFRLNEAIERLLRYSLLRRNAETRSLSMHRLVQTVLRDSMEPEQQRFWAERAVRAVNRVFPDVEVSTWAQCQRLLPQVQVSVTYIEEYPFVFPEAARLLHQAANYLSTHARYNEAEPLLQQALTIYRQILEPTHPTMAAILNDLGVLYLTQGRYQQSTPLLQQALEIRQRVLGEDHSDTAVSLNDLGQLYYAQGKYALAEQHYLQALSIRERLLETGHSKLAQSRSNLAELYTTQGKYDLAESLYLQALTSQKEALGVYPYHPDAAKTLSNLAHLYRSKGEYKRAEDIYQQVLDILQRILEPTHPLFAQAIYNLARLYRAQGKYTKAEPLYLRALSIRGDIFGPDHPLVAQSLYGLTKLYTSQGKYAEAEITGKHALEIQKRRLGSDHPDVVNTLGVLAKNYQDKQDFAEAEALNICALEIRERTSGTTHLHVAYLMNNLAEIYHAQGRYREARPLIEESLAIRQQTLGPDHIYMAYSWGNLAENCFELQDYVQAEPLFKKAVLIREQNLGLAHPRTAFAYRKLAEFYVKLYRYEEADELYRKVLTIYEHTLKPEHPYVVSAKKDYSNLVEARRQRG